MFPSAFRVRFSQELKVKAIWLSILNSIIEYICIYVYIFYSFKYQMSEMSHTLPKKKSTPIAFRLRQVQ